MKILIATIKQWNIDEANRLKEKYKNKHEIRLVTTKEELNPDFVNDYKPDYIFFPHWSDYIPKSIFENYECVVFHMTDLPFGRGGSPLQNLIVRGIKETKISALRVSKGLDEGPIYMKENMTLEGSATEIFTRVSHVIFNTMIPRFLDEKPVAVPQEGEVVEFKRRTKEDGQLKPEMSLETIYDYIRMLDAEGYPNAFMKMGEYTLEFTNASIENGEVTATVRFKKGEN